MAADIPQERDADALLLVGRFVKAHGLQGEVKVMPETDVPERFSQLRTVYVGSSAQGALPRTIESVRYQPSKYGTTVVLKLESVDDREGAERLASLRVFARVEDLPPLDDDEVFLADLVGLRVETEAGVVLGVVRDVLELPAQLVYVVTRDGQPDLMIPGVPEFVPIIEPESGRIVVRLIEGMLE
jgi:16S rRNA processing protein RimM